MVSRTVKKFGCSSWFMRAFIWASITAAFALSILSMERCDLVDGYVINYDLFEWDKEYINPTNATYSHPYWNKGKDPNDWPKRYQPETNEIGAFSPSFSLGVFKATSPFNNNVCIEYKNSYSELFMSYGGAERAAKLFGSLAALLGGVSMICFIAFAAGRIKNKVLLIIFSMLLYTAAIFQVFIFSLMKSDHCSDSYWNDFLPLRTQREENLFAVQCKIGTAGWYSISAVALYFTAGLLASLKWVNPKVALVELTVQHFEDDEESQVDAQSKKEEKRKLLNDDDVAAKETPKEQPVIMTHSKQRPSSETEAIAETEDEHLLSHVSDTFNAHDEVSEVTGVIGGDPAGSKSDGTSLIRTEC